MKNSLKTEALVGPTICEWMTCSPHVNNLLNGNVTFSNVHVMHNADIVKFIKKEKLSRIFISEIWYIYLYKIDIQGVF